MSHNLTITYELNPPAHTPSEGLARSRTLSFPVTNSTTGAPYGKYYDTLRTAIAQAKDAVGDDLTLWRDAVGNREQSKEPLKSKAADEEEEEEEEESEE